MIPNQALGGIRQLVFRMKELALTGRGGTSFNSQVRRVLISTLGGGACSSLGLKQLEQRSFFQALRTKRWQLLVEAGEDILVFSMIIPPERTRKEIRGDYRKQEDFHWETKETWTTALLEVGGSQRSFWSFDLLNYQSSWKRILILSKGVDKAGAL